MQGAGARRANQPARFWEDAKPAPWDVYSDGPRGMIQALHDILVIIRETRAAPADVKKQALDQIEHILFDRHGVTKDELAKYIPNTDEGEATP